MKYEDFLKTQPTMRDPVEAGMRVARVETDWPSRLLFIGILILLACLIGALKVFAGDADLLANIPAPNLEQIATPNLNALFGPLPVSVPTAPPLSPTEVQNLAAKAPVGAPPVAAVPVPPPAGALTPVCPNDGATDASSCIQAAVNQGSVVLPQGTYLAHGIRLPATATSAGPATSSLCTIPSLPVMRPTARSCWITPATRPSRT
jgi:hypothetical protein